MSSVNKVFLLGRLGRDPELRTAGNSQVCNFSMATDESFTDRSGERQKRTEWHNIVAWGRTAEVCSQYLKKGDLTHVEGSLQTREWEKDGVKRYSTEIVARSVQFIGQPKGGGSNRSGSDEPSSSSRDLPQDAPPF